MLEASLLDSQSFVVGFIVGGVVMSVVYRMFTAAANSYEGAQRSGRNVTVEVQGDQSPRDITRQSAQAGACLFFWLIAIFAGLAVISIVLYRIWNI